MAMMVVVMIVVAVMIMAIMIMMAMMMMMAVMFMAMMMMMAAVFSGAVLTASRHHMASPTLYPMHYGTLGTAGTLYSTNGTMCCTRHNV